MMYKWRGIPSIYDLIIEHKKHLNNLTKDSFKE